MSAAQILASHRASVVEWANTQAVVLALQDTTDLDFSGLKETSGLGLICQTTQPIASSTHRLIHPSPHIR